MLSVLLPALTETAGGRPPWGSPPISLAQAPAEAPPSSGVTHRENTAGPSGETGRTRWASARRGSGSLEDGRAGGGLTPHLVLPAKPRFLSAKWGGSWKLPLLGSCALTTTARCITCAENHLSHGHRLSKRDGEGRADGHRKQEGSCCPPLPASACRVSRRAGSPRREHRGQEEWLPGACAPRTPQDRLRCATGPKKP